MVPCKRLRRASCVHALATSMWILRKCGCLPGNCVFLCHHFPVVVLFSLLKIFVVQHKDLHQWWGSQPRDSNSVLSSFPEGHLQLLPWSRFVSPCSISVLCAITGCRIQFLKLASLKRPLWKTKHFNDHVYPLSRLLYNNFGFSFVDIQELKQHTVLWESKKQKQQIFLVLKAVQQELLQSRSLLYGTLKALSNYLKWYLIIKCI